MPEMYDKEEIYELSIASVKTIISKISGYSEMVQLFDYFENTIQKKNIQEVLHTHTEQINFLTEQMLDRFYMKSPEYIYDVISTLKEAKHTQCQQKRLVLAKYITACCYIQNRDSKNKHIFLNYLTRLDYIDIKIIEYLTTDFNALGTPKSFYDRYKDELNLTIDDTETHFIYLMSLGIADRIPDEFLKQYIPRLFTGNKRVDLINRQHRTVYVRSILGEQLIDFLSVVQGID